MAETTYNYAVSAYDSDQLLDEVQALGFAGLRRLLGSGPTMVQLVYDPALSGAQEDALEAAVLAHTPNATGPGGATSRRRVAAKALLDDDHLQPLLVLVRAVALVALDEINLLRTNPLTVLTPRTPAQLKTALRSKIDSGDAD